MGLQPKSRIEVASTLLNPHTIKYVDNANVPPTV